jgi:PhnB protein
MSKVKAIPDGLTAVTPHIVVAGAARAIDWYKKAFGATEEMRMPDPTGRIMHACIRIGGAAIFLVDEMPEWGSVGPQALKSSPVTIHLMVEDVDTVFDQAVKAGATVSMPVADQFWGDRYGVLRDPFGHSWSVATHIRDVTPAEIQQAMKQMAEQACK